MLHFLAGAAQFFIGVYLPGALTVWAAIGNKGLRTFRRLLREHNV